MLWFIYISVDSATSVVFLLIYCSVVSDILPEGDMKLIDEGVIVVDDKT